MTDVVIEKYLTKNNLHTNESIINKTDRYTYSDIEGYKYALSNGNIDVMSRRDSLPAKFYRNNPYTFENISNYILINNIPIIFNSDISIFKTATNKLSFSCHIHGDFNKTWNDIKNGQYCPDCGCIQGGESKKQDFNHIISEFSKVGYSIKTEKYINNETPIEYICNIHSDSPVQKMSWGAFITGQRCFHCTKIEKLIKITKPHDQFVSEVYKLFGNNINVVGSYINTKNKIEVYCNVCNMPFFPKPHHLLNGHLGCNCSSKSIGEDMIKEHLNNDNIIYEPQYRIKDCRFKKPLPFDFAIFSDKSKTELLFLVEFQGKQHYKNTGWSSDIVKNEKYFENQKRNDDIKCTYCSINNINLVIIPYWDINKISEILELEYKRLSAHIFQNKV